MKFWMNEANKLRCLPPLKLVRMDPPHPPTPPRPLPATFTFINAVLINLPERPRVFRGAFRDSPSVDRRSEVRGVQGSR